MHGMVCMHVWFVALTTNNNEDIWDTPASIATNMEKTNVWVGRLPHRSSSRRVSRFPTTNLTPCTLKRQKQTEKKHTQDTC